MATSKKTKKRTAAPSKKKRDEALKRSKAAKKGWATRRRNIAKAEVKKTSKRLANAQLGLPKKKRQANPRTSLANLTKKELIKLLREQKRQLKALESDDEWVDAMPEEYLSGVDRHIALMPSRLRHMGENTDIIRQRLQDAADISDEALEREAIRIARIMECPIREVYTLHHSP